MNRKWAALLGVAGLATIAAGLEARPVRHAAAHAAAHASSSQVGSGAEWHGVNGDTNETGYSQLAQITAANAARLGLAWFLDLPGEASLEASPVMADGVVYFTGSYASVYAVDAATGRLLWKYDPKTWEHNPAKMNYSFAANRGAAYDNGKVFVAALDGRLIALNAKTGAVLWSVETTDPKGMQTVTGAPRTFNGKVIIGQGGADMGQRGYVTAYDQATGRQLWRFYVVPASPDQNRGDPAMEAAAKTWNGDFWKTNGGGGGPWDSMTFDAEMNRIYVGTANAYDYDAEKRSPGGGDNLYTASVVALDANTGRYLWHYQVNPRDTWDFDSTQQMSLATLTIDGQPRKVLMQAPKNGFFYVLDRETGKLISAEKLGKVTWAERIDMQTGRPVEIAASRYRQGAFEVYPSGAGLHGWMRMAYSPQTGLVYVPTMQAGTRFNLGAPEDNEVHVGGVTVGEARNAAGDGKGTLIAWDPVAQKARWSAPLDTLFNGGVLATAGGLVFQGAADGWFSAYDARTGQRLWRFDGGMGIIGAPMTYSADGRQYVSILLGYGGTAGMFSTMNVGWKYGGPRRLLTFALDGRATLPPSPPRTMEVNAQDNPDEKLDPAAIAGGKAMFMACAACHGKQAVSAGGPGPDLRESAIPLDSEAFYTVVHEGALMEKGMPRFAFFERPQIEALRQYIRSRTRAAITVK